MKNQSRYSIPKPVPVILCLILIWAPGFTVPGIFAARAESKPVPDFSFSCTQSGEQFILKARLSYWNGDRDIPLGRSEINFYHLAGEESWPLETVQTEMDGTAEYRIDKRSDRLQSMEDLYTFRAVFEGNQDYEMSEDMVSVKPLEMSLDFVEVDTVKTIVARAYERDREGKKIPLEDTDVYFYVPRSFSLLPVGEEWFMGGRAQVDFPTTVPGDSAGNLTIVARIEDHELYGNVEAVAVKDWGKAVPRIVVKKRRGLGDTDAPLWMVYTLIVLLSIVWFHYLYVFFIMIKIKKLRRS
jgi:hypothetical protein